MLKICNKAVCFELNKSAYLFYVQVKFFTTLLSESVNVLAVKRVPSENHNVYIDRTCRNTTFSLLWSFVFDALVSNITYAFTHTF